MFTGDSTAGDVVGDVYVFYFFFIFNGYVKSWDAMAAKGVWNLSRAGDTSDSDSSLLPSSVIDLVIFLKCKVTTKIKRGMFFILGRFRF